MESEASAAHQPVPERRVRRIPLPKLIGGILLAVFLPPAFAIVIGVRWRDVPRWMRTAAIVFSFIIPLAMLWFALAEGTPTERLAEGSSCFAYYASYFFFCLCYMRHCKIRPSLFLKCAAAFLLLLLLLGFMAFIMLFVLGM